MGTLSENSDVYSERLANIIAAACQQTGKQVVVLIDEYDAPMHDSMNDEKLKIKSGMSCVISSVH